MIVRIPCLLVLAFITTSVTTAMADSPAETVKASLQNYFKAWNEPDAAKRAELLKTAWTDEGTYTDPTAHVEGRQALVTHIGNLLRNPQFAGASLQVTSDFDIHHRMFRFEWDMKNASGQSITTGMDYGEFDESGAITKIVGFFGPFPEAK